VPHRAELAVGAVVVAVVLAADLRGAIGFSSFAVLVYYAIANASALTLGHRRTVPAVGLAGCLVIAGALPVHATVAGSAVLATGALLWHARRRWWRPPAARG
jgi:APA family basic amino acid/polyamine antiporter